MYPAYPSMDWWKENWDALPLESKSMKSASPVPEIKAKRNIFVVSGWKSTDLLLKTRVFSGETATSSPKFRPVLGKKCSCYGFNIF